jgi:superfamily II DNA or RNA helicase
MTATRRSHIGKRERLGKLPAPRGYQPAAISAIVRGLRKGDRGQLRAACGTGKTLTSLYTAVKIYPKGLIVVTCPSLQLIAQTLKDWTDAEVTTDILAVCSDDTVADSIVRVKDLPCPVTTDVREIADWIKSKPSSRLRLILVTHRSTGVLGEGLKLADATADLLIVDEAHITAGLPSKQAALVHTNEELPATNRLYMTATPRVLSKYHRNTHSEDMLSMDDERVFGPVFYRYTFAEAIDDDWLDDYRVVVIGVTSSEALELLRKIDPNAVPQEYGAPIRTAAIQTALIRAVVEFQLRRMLVFSPRIALSREFVRTLPSTLEAIPDDERPPGPLTAFHVDSKQATAERQRRLKLLEEPPEGGWTVGSNARCLGVGVNVPAADGLTFTWKKESDVDVIQAVGRVMRRNRDGSGVATILVPVLLSDNPDEPINLGEWATVLKVLRALRSHDEELALQLDEQRVHAERGNDDARLPPRVLLRLPEGYSIREQVLQHITLRILEETTSDWLVGYSALLDFIAENGHMRMPDGYMQGNVSLARWVAHQRSVYLEGRLSRDRIDKLDEIGFEWQPKIAAWKKGLAAAKKYYAEHGHLNGPFSVPVNDVSLGIWLRYQRRLHELGKLEPDRVAALTALGFQWHKKRATPAQAHAAVKKYYAQHGHLNAPYGYIVDGVDVYKTLAMRRVQKNRGTLSQASIDEYNSMGMIWSTREVTWQRNLATLTDFYRQHGHLRPSKGYRAGGIDISKLVNTLRKRRDKLTKAQVAQLKAIGMEWEVNRGWRAYHETKNRR